MHPKIFRFWIPLSSSGGCLVVPGLLSLFSSPPNLSHSLSVTCWGHPWLAGRSDGHKKERRKEGTAVTVLLGWCSEWMEDKQTDEAAMRGSPGGNVLRVRCTSLSTLQAAIYTPSTPITATNCGSWRQSGTSCFSSLGSTSSGKVQTAPH